MYIYASINIPIDLCNRIFKRNSLRAHSCSFPFYATVKKRAILDSDCTRRYFFVQNVNSFSGANAPKNHRQMYFFIFETTHLFTHFSIRYINMFFSRKIAVSENHIVDKCLYIHTYIYIFLYP